MKASLFLTLGILSLPLHAADQPPNVVIIFCDDLGYADVGCFGAEGYSTPNIDRLAKEGRRFTNFHVAQPVCSASRAALQTGCYPNRIGIHGALGPNADHGIADSEVTLGELFRSKGYATAAVGKWHLGHHTQFLPTHHGYDEFLGLPYSNDMWPRQADYTKPPPSVPKQKQNYPNLRMYENDRVIDEDITSDDQRQLTTRYTERAVSFIARNKQKPFFLYLAHSMPHVPLFVSDKFAGKSQRGLFGDVIMEIDWSVGQVMDALDKNGVAENTLVIFTSDNGPWLCFGDHAGSAKPLREGKGTCWEGGTREACVMRWPGKISGGRTCDDMLMTIDLFPTFAKLLGADLPDHKIDGLDVSPILLEKPGAANPHEAYFSYYNQNELHAVTTGDGHWKLYLPHIYRTLAGKPGGKGGRSVPYQQVKLNAPELYDLKSDISETTDVSAQHPDIVEKLQQQAELARADLGDALTRRKGPGNRPPGQVRK